MNEQRQYPCKIEDRILSPCYALHSLLVAPSVKRGLYFQPFINLEDGEVTSTCVIAKSELHKNGVVVNFCPFCGLNISEHMKG